MTDWPRYIRGRTTMRWRSPACGSSWSGWLHEAADLPRPDLRAGRSLPQGLPGLLRAPGTDPGGLRHAAQDRGRAAPPGEQGQAGQEDAVFDPAEAGVTEHRRQVKRYTAHLR